MTGERWERVSELVEEALKRLDRVRDVRELECVEAARQVTAREARDAERQADVMRRFVRNLLRASDPDESPGRPFTAGEVLERAEARVRHDLDDERDVLAHALEAIGLSHQARGSYGAARRLLGESLVLRRAFYGGDHPLTARGLNNLGALEHMAGDLERAVKLYRLALGMKERLGLDEAKLLKVRSNLASILTHRGSFAGPRRPGRAGRAAQAAGSWRLNACLRSTQPGILEAERSGTRDDPTA